MPCNWNLAFRLESFALASCFAKKNEVNFSFADMLNFLFSELKPYSVRVIHSLYRYFDVW